MISDSLGRSWLSRNIRFFSVGNGGESCVAAGGFLGGDGDVSAFLSGFASELGEGGRIGDVNVGAVLSGTSVKIVPELNPDGQTLYREGILPDNPFRDRVAKIASGTPVAGNWEANARGVRLDGNFAYRWTELKREEKHSGIYAPSPNGYFGEFPESEAESSALCRFCRSLRPSSVIEVRRGEDTSVAPCPDVVSENAVRAISAYTGIKISSPSFSGSFAGWACENFASSGMILTVGKAADPEALKSSMLLFFAL